jgi:hypothetical protein
LWVKPIVPKGSLAIVFFNTRILGSGTPIRTAASDIGMSNPKGYRVTEVFTGKDLGIFKPETNLTARVFTTDAYMIVCHVLS